MIAIQHNLVACLLSLCFLCACSDNNSTIVSDSDGSNNPLAENGDDGNNSAADDNGTNNTQITNAIGLKDFNSSEAFYAALQSGLDRKTPDTYAGDTTGGSAGDPTSDVLEGNTDAGRSTEVADESVTTDGEYLYVLKSNKNPAYSSDLQLSGGATTGGTFEPEAIEQAREASQYLTELRILGLQNDVPDATQVTDLALGFQDGKADGMYLHRTDSSQHLIATSSGVRYAYNGPGGDEAPRIDELTQGRSTVAKIDLTNPEQASVEKTIRLDGRIISSRRIGNNLFLATRYTLESDTTDKLEEADFKAMLPKVTHLESGSVSEMIDFTKCFIATSPEELNDHFAPSILSLSIVDMDTLELKDSKCYLGESNYVYSTAKSVFLANNRSRSDDAANADINTARVHRFAIDGDNINYSGSQAIAGNLYSLDSLSEWKGSLRVVTSTGLRGQSVNQTILSVLDVSGDGDLDQVAQLPLADYPERIGNFLFRPSFLGDQAYLLADEEATPTLVVDFSNPKNPKLLGDLELSYSVHHYLFPIEQDYLLSIRRGRDNGVNLSLINVSDATNPSEVQSIVIGENGTNMHGISGSINEAGFVTIEQATADRPARVAFGISVDGMVEPRPVIDPDERPEYSLTGLFGFDIITGADAQIIPRGVMIANTPINPVEVISSNSPARSIMVNDAVYYVFGGNVFAAHWDNLDNLVGPR